MKVVTMNRKQEQRLCKVISIIVVNTLWHFSVYLNTNKKKQFF